MPTTMSTTMKTRISPTASPLSGRRTAVAVAGVFVLLALPVSAYEVALQLQYFARPRLQLRVVRILWMVPVYALNSWFALKYKV